MHEGAKLRGDHSKMENSSCCATNGKLIALIWPYLLVLCYFNVRVRGGKNLLLTSEISKKGLQLVLGNSFFHVVPPKVHMSFMDAP